MVLWGKSMKRPRGVWVRVDSLFHVDAGCVWLRLRVTCCQLVGQHRNPPGMLRRERRPFYRFLHKGRPRKLTEARTNPRCTDRPTSGDPPPPTSSSSGYHLGRLPRTLKYLDCFTIGAWSHIYFPHLSLFCFLIRFFLLPFFWRITFSMIGS
jgi:hypothetical protein